MRRLLLLMGILTVLLSILVFIRADKRVLSAFKESSEAEQVSQECLWYDLLSQALVIDREALKYPDDTDGCFGITETDLYHALEYEFLIPVNDSAEFTEGMLSVSNWYIDGFDVSRESGGIRLIAHERRIAAFIITSDASAVYIKPVHPRERHGKIVLLDPGHGGEDQGAVSAKGIITFNGENRLIEKDYNLALAKRLEDMLAQTDIKVYLTRVDDTFISLEQRRNLRDYKADLFVSLHVNASEYSSMRGLWTFFYENTEDIAYRSKLFAMDMLYCIAETTAADKYDIDRGDYAVLRDSRVPAVLVEVGFLSNRHDLEKLVTEEFFENTAQGVYDGIIKGFDEVGGR